MTIGDNIKLYRKSIGKSQRSVAKEVGVSQVLIHFWEHGKRTPSLVHVKKLAKIFSISLLELIESE